jgi:exonuclease SbcC
MRPLRIEIEGFSAFRDRTVVSFDGVELFAFVGATGAGKSSLIDALTFALYGKVARYQDDRMVAPVINVQSAEAKVRLDFEVAGVAHTVVRVVRRTAKGASTKEARLERGADVLAGDARSLDAAVEHVLGLSFEQFTKTVVLPQGDFAAFLHSAPRERQDLLVRLLDLGVYGDVGRLARARANAADAQRSLVDHQLEQLGVVDAGAAKAARRRAAELTSLRASLRGTLGDIEAIDAQLRDLDADEQRLAHHRGRLAGLEVPESARRFDEDHDAAAAVLDAAAQTLADARAARDRVHAALAGEPDPQQLRETRAAYGRHAELGQLIERADERVRGAHAQLDALDDEVRAADDAVASAAEALEVARRRAGARALRHELHVGEPCPVCEQPVATLPAAVPDDELAQAKAAHDAATRARTGAERRRDERTRNLAKADAAKAQLLDEAERLTQRLAAAAPVAEIDAALQRHAELQVQVDAALESVRRAELAHTRADKGVKAMAAAERRLRSEFHATRDSFAALEPPAAAGDDLLGDWVALLSWADQAQQRVAGELAGIVSQRRVLIDKRDSLWSAVVTACAPHDIDPAQPALLEQLATLAAHADAEAARIDDAVARVEALRAERAALHESQQVADELGRLLAANGFERWLLEEAVDELVAGASDRLFALSSGQFSLERRDNDFAVRDHRNADELRSVKTLSGGETFLASLSLALALADNVTSLSSVDAPKLDSIFLDEGFGTLDPETLDVVAVAIEELGASGRLVGVVTHIRELADRLPTRFEVSKLGSTSLVERVER